MDDRDAGLLPDEPDINDSELPDDPLADDRPGEELVSDDPLADDWPAAEQDDHRDSGNSDGTGPEVDNPRAR